MEKQVLKWGLIPAEAYVHLQKFEGDEAYYFSIVGSGIYLMIHSNGNRYQVYYIGETKEIGKRLWEHVDAYTGGNPNYWLPVSADLFNGNIVDLFNRNSGEKFKQQGSDFTKEEREKVGKEIMRQTYFVFANLPKENCKEIEAVLHEAILKKNGFKNKGWLGEKTSSLPKKDIVIKNEFLASYVEKMILSSLPKEIKLVDGSLKW